jgi:hypothetical protein
MRRAALFLTAAALVVGAANLSAQTVNFSGTWTPVVDPNAPAGRGGGGNGPMTITMDAKTMTITRTTQAGETKAVYNLDGSDSKNMMAGRNGAAGTEVISKAKLDGGKVIVSTTQDRNGTSVTTTVTYWLDGGKLMSSSLSNQPSRDGGAPVAQVRTYTKS